MIEFIHYMTIFTGSDMDNKICQEKLNDIILHNMPNGWDKPDFMQGFDFETMNFNKSINMFEYMNIL